MTDTLDRTASDVGAPGSPEPHDARPGGRTADPLVAPSGDGRSDRRLDARRIGVVGVMGGAAAMVAGLGVDADAGRVVLLAGAATVVAGLALALVGPTLYAARGAGAVGMGRRVLQLLAPLGLVALVVATVGWGGRSSVARVPAGPTDGAAAAGTSAPTAAGTTGPGDAHDHDHGPPSTAGTAASGATAVGSNGGAAPAGAAHDHGSEAYVPLDLATQQRFSAEMAQVRDITMQYPTVAAAKAAGFTRVGPFAPGSAAHYLAPQPTTALSFKIDHPIIWLYSGNEDTSVVVGVMYFAFSADAPEGFAGPNDHWHVHHGLCLGAGAGGIEIALPVDQDTTKEQCDAAKGRYMATTGWMVHVWSAPGWESPVGVFSHDNPLLQCTDGTDPAKATLDKGCKGLG